MRTVATYLSLFNRREAVLPLLEEHVLGGGERGRQFHFGHQVKDVIEAVGLGNDSVAALQLIPQGYGPAAVLHAVILNR